MPDRFKTIYSSAHSTTHNNLRLPASGLRAARSRVKSCPHPAVVPSPMSPAKGNTTRLVPMTCGQQLI